MKEQDKAVEGEYCLKCGTKYDFSEQLLWESQKTPVCPKCGAEFKIQK